MHNNGSILNTSTIMRNVMASASEAEFGELFNNTKEDVYLHTTLHKMGHPQPPNHVEINNSTAVGFAIKKIKRQKSKSMDMRNYWIQDCVAQIFFKSIGDLAIPILVTISPNISLLPTTKAQDPLIYKVPIM